MFPPGLYGWVHTRYDYRFILCSIASAPPPFSTDSSAFRGACSRPSGRRLLGSVCERSSVVFTKMRTRELPKCARPGIAAAVRGEVHHGISDVRCTLGGMCRASRHPGGCSVLDGLCSDNWNGAWVATDEVHRDASTGKCA